MVHLVLGQRRVDGDQRVVATDRPPGGAENPVERLDRITTVRLGGCDRAGHVPDGVVGNGFDQRITGGEVRVDRRTYDAGLARDLGHARIGVAGEAVDGRVEDQGNVARGI